jgi:putative transcription antitermination factor YqgF
VGFAVGDDTTGVTSPLEIVPYEGVDRSAQQIAILATKVGAARVVLGLPTLEDGSRGPASRRTERLAEALEALGVDVVMQGEILSTNEARRRARAAGRPSRQPVDDIAAQVLLEEHLASGTAAPSVES